MGLALEYFKCVKCGNVWLDDPRDGESWVCKSCGVRDHVVLLTKPLLV